MVAFLLVSGDVALGLARETNRAVLAPGRKPEMFPLHNSGPSLDSAGWPQHRRVRRLWTRKRRSLCLRKRCAIACGQSG